MATVVVDGLRDGVLRASVEDQLTALLARLRVRATNTRVLFSDQNGPRRRGIDIRCLLTLDVAGRGEPRARVQRRRPKKYYLAKRLLAGGDLRAAARTGAPELGLIERQRISHEEAPAGGREVVRGR